MVVAPSYPLPQRRLPRRRPCVPPRRIYVSPSTIPELLPGGVRYPRCPIDGTAEAESEAEAAAASASSDLEKKFRSHSDEIGEGEGEGRRFSLFPFSSA